MTHHKAILIILDGWGIGNKKKSDAIFNGETPYIDSLTSNYPHSHLITCGEEVGLPHGQMGNSEVGHLNIGAGRVMYQDFVKINRAIADNSIAQMPVLKAAFEYARDNNKAVHFLGLISDGGVHSHVSHLQKLCDLSAEYAPDRTYIHAITDGRDVDPKSGLNYILDLQKHLENSNGKIASLIGRYYTMDRDKRWERIKLGYDLMVKGIGTPCTDLPNAIQESYNQDITDEFIKPLVMVNPDGSPLATIQADDVVICFNFRTDRLRQITTVLTQQDMPEYEMNTIPLHYVTLTLYDKNFKGINVVYGKENLDNTLGEVLEKHGLKQLRIAETEKYAHVTFFFSGGREKEFNGETRILVNSPKVATYDLQPEMSAYEVADALVVELNKQIHDFIVLNFANGDMVGHTGDYQAILKAVKAVDENVKRVTETAKSNGYTVLIIADHGNADYAVNDDGSINTAHSLNPVPCILVSDEYKAIKNGILADVAPTLLKIMGIEIPKDMTGTSLI